MQKLPEPKPKPLISIITHAWLCDHARIIQVHSSASFEVISPKFVLSETVALACLFTFESSPVPQPLLSKAGECAAEVHQQEMACIAPRLQQTCAALKAKPKCVYVKKVDNKFSSLQEAQRDAEKMYHNNGKKVVLATVSFASPLKSSRYENERNSIRGEMKQKRQRKTNKKGRECVCVLKDRGKVETVSWTIAQSCKAGIHNEHQKC